MKRTAQGDALPESDTKKRKIDTAGPAGQKPHPKVDYIHRAKIYGAMQPLIQKDQSEFLTKATTALADSPISTQFRLMSSCTTKTASGRFPQFKSISVDGQLIFGKDEADDPWGTNQSVTVDLPKLKKILGPDDSSEKPIEIAGHRIQLGYQSNYFGRFYYDGEPASDFTSDIQKMAPSGFTFTTKLHKMVIFEQGCTLPQHSDAPHADNHYATLFVALTPPKSTKGGTFVLSADGKPEKYSLFQTFNTWGATSYVQWLLFLTDVPYEICTVKKGCRTYLQFDILLVPKPDEPAALTSAPEKPVTIHRRTATKKKVNKKKGAAGNELHNAYEPTKDQAKARQKSFSERSFFEKNQIKILSAEPIIFDPQELLVLIEKFRAENTKKDSSGEVTTSICFMLTDPRGYLLGTRVEDLVGADKLLFETLAPHYDLDLGYAINRTTADFEGCFNEEWTKYDRLKLMTYQDTRRFYENLFVKVHEDLEGASVDEEETKPPCVVFFGNSSKFSHCWRAHTEVCLETIWFSPVLCLGPKKKDPTISAPRIDYVYCSKVYNMMRTCLTAGGNMTRGHIAEEGAPLSKEFRLLTESTAKWSEGALPQFKSIKVDGTTVFNFESSRSSMDIKKIRSLMKPASFGSGGKTVYDEKVRKASEIAGSRITLEWQPLVAAGSPQGEAHLLAEIQKMAPKGKKFDIKLYKMHIYETGGKFDRHIDTLHATNHYATLIISLPFTYEGGQFVLEADGDLPHQVKPITGGSRLVLQYDVFVFPRMEYPQEFQEAATGNLLATIPADLVPLVRYYVKDQEEVKPTPKPEPKKKKKQRRDGFRFFGLGDTSSESENEGLPDGVMSVSQLKREACNQESYFEKEEIQILTQAEVKIDHSGLVPLVHEFVENNPTTHVCFLLTQRYPLGVHVDNLRAADRVLYELLSPHYELDLGYAVNPTRTDYDGGFKKANGARYNVLRVMTYQDILRIDKWLSDPDEKEVRPTQETDKEEESGGSTGSEEEEPPIKKVAKKALKKKPDEEDGPLEEAKEDQPQKRKKVSARKKVAVDEDQEMGEDSDHVFEPIPKDATCTVFVGNGAQFNLVSLTPYLEHTGNEAQEGEYVYASVVLSLGPRK